MSSVHPRSENELGGVVSNSVTVHSVVAAHCRSAVPNGAAVSYSVELQVVYVWHCRSLVDVAALLSNSAPTTQTLIGVHSLSEVRVAELLTNSEAVHAVRLKQVRSEVDVGAADSYSAAVHALRSAQIALVVSCPSDLQTLKK